jgi:hypothetical protein
VYSTLLFSPTTQTCCSEAEEGLAFFDEEFYANDYPRSIASGVMESSAAILSRVFDLVFCKTLFV